MSKIAKILTGIGLFALAVVLVFHTASLVLTRKNPPLALAAFPGNGDARERSADLTFRLNATAPDQIGAAAKLAEADAHRAIRLEPLSPRAITFLALATDDPARKDAMFAAATALDRRELTLEGSLLNHHLANGRFDDAVTVFDSILRVRPHMSSELLPVLAASLRVDETVAPLAEVLGRGPEWGSDFFEFASADPAVLSNLYVLRTRLGDSAGISPRADMYLQTNLVRARRFDDAWSLYERQQGEESGVLAPGDSLDWSDETPPFDWRLTSQAGFRARTGSDPTSLELDVKQGSGGVIARRMIPTDLAMHGLSVDMRTRSAPSDYLLRLAISCPFTAAKLAEKDLRSGMNRFVLSSRPDCDFVSVVIEARAWRTGGGLQAELSRVKIGR